MFAHAGAAYNLLKPNETVEGFKLVSVYLSGSGHRMGVRFMHVKIGLHSTCRKSNPLRNILSMQILTLFLIAATRTHTNIC